MTIRMLFAIALFVAALISVSGCVPATHQFIVYRDVPDSPSFVVIPATNQLYQVHFANEVESAFIGCGVKVVVPPEIKEITIEKSVRGRVRYGDHVSRGGGC